MADAREVLRMEVRGLMIDPASKAPIVLLRDVMGESLLPIWIGPFEATAISLAFERAEVPRPMTHDLFLSTLGRLGATVSKVEVTDLREGTFFAEIHLLRQGEPLVLDARPSDALALALRAQCPIFVQRAVLAKVQALAGTEDDEEAQDRLRRLLDEIDPEDLGKYTM